MTEEQENDGDNKQQDDYQEYLREMEELKTDFSDLEDLDAEEIEAMEEAIELVKEAEKSGIEPAIIEEETEEIKTSETKDDLMVDFTDLGKMDLNELLEMKKAVDMVKQEENSSSKFSDRSKSSSASSDELEKRIEQELKKKKHKEKKEIVTEKDFLEYVKKKRDKIWYHALYFLTYQMEDHTASKELLYDVLKEDTSKSPINPIAEHQFFFGLGYLLRLNINERQLIRYLPGGKFKINIDVKIVKDILEEAGKPIITKPSIEEEKKKQMFRDFLADDFSDL
ncbi:MAG: hypothetical protein BAJALOKI1v1_1000009 [Promethearchaeota archaeon]|nr:MAG: hypothetical protein BAJALOKI1v1_1000009 [Candidatus Lokiarchaeota archaeon]